MSDILYMILPLLLVWHLGCFSLGGSGLPLKRLLPAKYRQYGFHQFHFACQYCINGVLLHLNQEVGNILLFVYWLYYGPLFGHVLQNH
jgi:hypothetical protein